jgi:hypothetical protein
MLINGIISTTTGRSLLDPHSVSTRLIRTREHSIEHNTAIVKYDSCQCVERQYDIASPVIILRNLNQYCLHFIYMYLALRDLVHGIARAR